MTSTLRRGATVAVFVLLLACSSQPPAGDPNNPNQTGGTSSAGGSTGTGATGSGGTGAGTGAGAAGGTSAGGSAGTGNAGGTGGATSFPSAECQQLAAMLLADMTLQEKAAQMVMAPNPLAAEVTQYAPGAVFSEGGASPADDPAPSAWAAGTAVYKEAALASRQGIPILYAADVVHGNNVATGAVVFPHNIGLGCTANEELIEEIGRITAREAVATGITWTFAPMITASFDDRWGRAYESFSEDVELTGKLSGAIVRGLQGASGLGTGDPGMVACAKHWAGDGQATAGTSAKGGVVDRGNVELDETAMRELGIAPYLPALEAQLGSVMVSDARWNGMSMTSSHRLVTEILKDEIGFKGFVATDYNAASDGPGIPATINAGVDMLMEFTDWKGAAGAIAEGVTNGGISMARVDDAVTRIVTMKCEAGLFEEQADPTLLDTVGSAAHREVARQAVRESLVLLKNDGATLPLSKTASVWVGGTGANSLDRQCGGWTISWQGVNGGSTTTGTTIQQAIGNVTTLAGSMEGADAIVVVLSEPPYAEFLGDVSDIDTLPEADFTLLSQAQATGKPVVAIVLGGRPALIEAHLGNADAWIAAWLPGTEGDGVADVLFGDYAPTGKLSHSWPRTNAQANVNFGDPGYDPLFQLGHGLTY